MPDSTTTKDVTQTKRKTSPIVLLPYMFLCTIGPNITAATSLHVVRYLMCRYYYQQHDPNGSTVYPGDGRCIVGDVGALTASVMAALATLDGVMSFLTTSAVQRLADRIGRKPLLVCLPFLAMIANASLMIAYGIQSTSLSFILLIINGLFSSASSKSIFLPTLCVPDLVGENERATSYGRLEAVGVFGPGVAFASSALITRYVPQVIFPYYVALGCQALAGLYALFVIPETYTPPEEDGSGSKVTAESGPAQHENQEASNNDHEDEDANSHHSGEDTPILTEALEVVITPIKPLELLLPRTGRLRLFFLSLSVLVTTAGTIFVSTALLLYMGDRFGFGPEKNSWVLAYVTFARGIYLILIFPLILKFGRVIYARSKARSTRGEEGTERQPLLQQLGGGQGGLKGLRKAVSIGSMSGDVGVEANRFDIMFALWSVFLDAAALIFLFFAKTWQQVLGSLVLLAFAAGDAPLFKASFIVEVDESEVSVALAAVDIILNISKLASPPILGAAYSLFVIEDKPQVVFLLASGLCLLGCVSLGPVVWSRRK